MREMKNVYEILVRKPEVKRRLGRLRHRWENNIRMDPKGMVWEGVDCIHLAQDTCQ
jgi:hypothetical protein